MRICGVVSEYNPFHKGHAYQIEQAKTKIGEDCAVICCMSSNFVQRGDTAILPKHLRAKAAVLSGADVFVSGDFRHNHAADALRAQISLVDAGHYETEALVRDRVIARLSAALPAVQFLRAESDQPIFQYQLMPSCGADSCGA